MSSGSAPNSGYMLETTDANIKALNISLPSYQEELDACKAVGKSVKDFLVELYDEDLDFEIMCKLAGQTFQVYPYIYNYEDGGIYDDLEDGVLYLIFNMSDIYTMEKTDIGKALESNNIFPEFQQWTEYG